MTSINLNLFQSKQFTINLVCGPVQCGKTTYIQKHKRPTDYVHTFHYVDRRYLQMKHGVHWIEINSGVTYNSFVQFLQILINQHADVYQHTFVGSNRIEIEQLSAPMIQTNQN